MSVRPRNPRAKAVRIERFETDLMHISTACTYLIMSLFLGSPRLATSYALMKPVHLLFLSEICVLVTLLASYFTISRDIPQRHILFASRPFSDSKNPDFHECDLCQLDDLLLLRASSFGML